MRPVDLNNLIPKTQQISKIQQVENDRHKNFMHNQISNQNKKFENELKKVNTTDKAYEAKIKKDEKNNKNNKNSKENTKHDEKEKEKGKSKKITAKSNGVIGSRIDIKV